MLPLVCSPPLSSLPYTFVASKGHYVVLVFALKVRACML